MACGCCRERSRPTPRAGSRSGSTPASWRDRPSATRPLREARASRQFMADADVNVFQLDRGREALEKYAAANRLTVQVYGADAGPAAEPLNHTALFDLFSEGHGPGMFATCARQCLSQSRPGPPVIVEEQYGLAVVGIPLVLAGAI